jgi:ATP-binding cassette subfamily F protein 3
MEARLADPAIYLDTSKEALEGVLRDQAYVGKELGQLEGEWLEKQAELELTDG